MSILSLYLFREVYDVLVKDGTIVPKPEKNPPTVPMDYSWAQVSEKINKANLDPFHFQLILFFHNNNNNFIAFFLSKYLQV